MPVPANVIRANIRATLGTQEEMVHTLHFVRVNTTVAEPPTLQEIADLIVGNWNGMMTQVFGGGVTLASRLSNDTVYQTVDVYALDAQGHATDQAQASFPNTAKGTAGVGHMPPECAIVVSLRTGLPGRSKRGRLYLGGFAPIALKNEGIVEPVVQQAIVASLDAFGTGMKFETPANVDRLNWVVLSRTTTTVARITELRCGSLWDVQRRRQNGMQESYETAQITY